MPSTLQTEIYTESNYPPVGKHIIAQHDDNLIVVYQAYKKSIAEFAVANQKLGGPDYSFNRMSWIKPNFLWMMYRSGWAQKAGQERILAFWIRKKFFDDVLIESVSSTFDAGQYALVEQWKFDLNEKACRLQWDPDHDPYGAPLQRRAIQLGLKGSILKKFALEEICRVEDITTFVHEQHKRVAARRLENLIVPVERCYIPSMPLIREKIGLNT